MQCGECTLCCELLEIKSLNKPACQLCSFCGIGCTIHGEHPDECKGFECMYYQVKEASINMRPDRCAVIFEKVNDMLIWGTKDPKKEITHNGDAQIKRFVDEGFSVMIKELGRKAKLYLNPNHTPDKIKVILQEFRKNNS